MRKLLPFFVGMIVGGGLVGFGFEYHVVYTNDGLSLIPKQQASLHDLFADVRNWTPADWQAHPDLARSLLARGRGDVIGGPGPKSDFLRDLTQKMDNAEKSDDDRRME